MEKYGPLATWVIYGSNLIAAVWALRVAALGKALWEPKVDEFPRAPVRIAGIGAILSLAVVFALTHKHKELEFWLPWAWVFLPLFGFFITDVFFRQALIVRCDSCTPVFGGLWLTPRAKAILAGVPEAYRNHDLAEGDPPPASAAILYCSFPADKRDRTRVWPRSSIAAATSIVVAVYCIWNVLAIAAIVIAATLVVISV